MCSGAVFPREPFPRRLSAAAAQLVSKPPRLSRRVHFMMFPGELGLASKPGRTYSDQARLAENLCPPVCRTGRRIEDCSKRPVIADGQCITEPVQRSGFLDA